MSNKYIELDKARWKACKYSKDAYVPGLSHVEVGHRKMLMALRERGLPLQFCRPGGTRWYDLRADELSSLDVVSYTYRVHPEYQQFVPHPDLDEVTEIEAGRVQIRFSTQARSMQEVWTKKPTVFPDFAGNIGGVQGHSQGEYFQFVIVATGDGRWYWFNSVEKAQSVMYHTQQGCITSIQLWKAGAYPPSAMVVMRERYQRLKGRTTPQNTQNEKPTPPKHAARATLPVWRIVVEYGTTGEGLRTTYLIEAATVNDIHKRFTEKAISIRKYIPEN